MRSSASRTKGTMIWVVVAIVAMTGAGFASGFVIGQMTAKTGPTVIDDYGRTIKLSSEPKRIVSVAPTPTEILFAVGAGDLVVGVDDYSDYPAEAAALPKVGEYPPNVETILGLKPDLVISSDLVPLQQLASLEEKGVPYIILAARDLQDVYNDIKLVGLITGHIEDANKLVSSLEDRVDAVTAKTLAPNVSAPSVYVEYYPMWTYGPGSFGDDLIKLAGGTNVAANTTAEYVAVTDEFVIAQNPEMIIYTTGSNYNGTTPSTLSARPGWGSISAVENGKMYSVEDNLVSRYGPRIVDGLEAMAELIHPELF